MEEGKWLLSRSGGGYAPGGRSRPHLAGKDAAVHVQATEGEELEAAAGEEVRLRVVLCVRRPPGGGARGAPAGRRWDGSGGARGQPGRGGAGDLAGARRCGARPPAAGDLTGRGGPRGRGGTASCLRWRGASAGAPRGSDGGGGARRPPAGAGQGTPTEALSRAGTWGRGGAAASGWVGWGRPGV
jgi:hypothetical protein